jgi:hypothetical protein
MERGIGDAAADARARVLVIEDSPSDAAMVTALLDEAAPFEFHLNRATTIAAANNALAATQRRPSFSISTCPTLRTSMAFAIY